MTSAGAVPSPAAPARWGEPVTPAAMLAYLDELGRWLDARRRELDELDRAALASPDADAVAADVTLAMALWQAVQTRYRELETVWDSGRVGAVELQRLSALIWGRLDAGAAGRSMAVSLPEACRLSDALAGQLRQRLALDPVAQDLATRLRELRAGLERVRDLIDADAAVTGRRAPGAQPGGPTAPADPGRGRLAALDRRVADVTDRARRGADVGGLLGPLETDLALAERDLIVAAATRRDDARDRERAEAQRTALVARAVEVSAIADRCVARVTPAPLLAVPRAEALGPVPDDAVAVDAYLVRLAAVERALAQADAAYRAPLAELEDLTTVLGAYHAKAVATGQARRPEVEGLHRSALAVLAEVPVDLDRARAVVAAFQTLLAAHRPPVPSPGRTS